MGDQAWLTQYRHALDGKNVPAMARERRERELLDSVLAAAEPAAELFGSAKVVAAEDVSELSTPDEAVRLSVGGGLRPALREIGNALVGVAVVAIVLLAIRNGWSVDLMLADTLVAVSVVIAYVGWVTGRAFLAAGRTVAMTSTFVVAAALAVAGIATAAALGSGRVLADGVSLLALSLGILAPGVASLIVSKQLPEQALRDSWDDAAWLKRFAGGLRARLVAAAAVRVHVAEVQRAVAMSEKSAYSEFGHPLALARELADANAVARSRRWWVSVIAGTGIPLVIAVSIYSGNTWEAMTVPIAAFLALSAFVTLIVGWNDRPWKKRG